MVYKRPWCLLGPGNYSMAPVSVHMSVTIYNSVQEDLIFVVTKKKKTSLIQKEYSFFSCSYSFVLLSKAYMNILFQKMLQI